jgi:KTSC domain
MLLETVESDVIHAIGYDPEIQLLEIIFNDGRIYQYRGVPLGVFDGLKGAASKGHYFQENIRGEFQYWQYDAQAAKFVRGSGEAEKAEG